MNGLKLVLAAISLCAHADAAYAQVRFYGLGELGSGDNRGSIPLGVSGDGNVAVGLTSIGKSGTTAFRWSPKTGMQDLVRPVGVDHATARGTSGLGDTIVGYMSVEAVGQRPFRWTAAGGMQDLGYLPYYVRGGAAFSSSGDGTVVVGRLVGDNRTQAFRWDTTEGMSGLGWLETHHTRSGAFDVSTDASVIVGYSGPETGPYEAVRWAAAGGQQSLGHLPGMVSTVASAVSADGSTIVGGSRFRSHIGEAFIWNDDDGMVGLGDLPGGEFGSEANAVSGDGLVVVGFSLSGTGNNAFIWDAQHGMRSLYHVLAEDYHVDLDDWTLSVATGISDDANVIVGRGWRTGYGYEEGWMVVLPSPASAWLVGLALLAWWRRLALDPQRAAGQREAPVRRSGARSVG